MQREIQQTNGIPDWLTFKKTFTQKQEDALWQFFIDHSLVKKSGFLTVTFGVKNMDDLWKRVYSRYTGDFQRYNKLKKEEKLANRAIYTYEAISRERDSIARKIDSSGGVKDKIILWLYRKTRDYLFPKV